MTDVAEIGRKKDAPTSRCLIATWPCGCIGAVASVLYLEPSEQAQFFKENTEDGALIENVTMDEYRARGGVVDCPHDPKWGGTESKYVTCDECGKRVLKKQDGTPRAHTYWRGMKCQPRGSGGKESHA